MNEPKVLTRMRLSCCWGDNLNEKELNEVVDYINYLQNNWNELKKYISEQLQYYSLCEDDYKEFNILDSVERKIQELEGNNEKINQMDKKDI